MENLGNLPQICRSWVHLLSLIPSWATFDLSRILIQIHCPFLIEFFVVLS